MEIIKLSRQLVQDLEMIFYDKEFRNRNFQDQIMRASISIWNNIAEWRERSSNRDFIHFLYYSKWSCWEVRSMLYSVLDFEYITKEQFDYFFKECIKINVKIHKFIESLK